jgi:rhodanese-related sulfurtransferase
MNGIISARDFSKARPHELVKTEFEFLQPDGAGEVLYWYPARGGGMARRYWALQGKLLVGGSFRDQSDAMHLARDFGVTHVLSFESEHNDDDMWSASRRGSAPFPDDGKIPPLLPLILAVKWVKGLPDDAVLYCHCRLGGSRGPSAAYLVLRARFNMNREVAQKFAGRRQCGSALFVNYLATIDKAIQAVTGRGPNE